MKFYISSAFLNTREIMEIAKVADDLGYDGMGIPDHIVNLETLSTLYIHPTGESWEWLREGWFGGGHVGSRCRRFGGGIAFWRANGWVVAWLCRRGGWAPSALTTDLSLT
jgi:hypothetical protein